MFEGRDPSCEIVNEANRAFVVESGPIRPIIDFPQSEQAGRRFKFPKKWYEEFNWLEYSVSKDVAFRFTCRCFGSLGKRNAATVLSYPSIVTLLCYDSQPQSSAKFVGKDQKFQFFTKVVLPLCAKFPKKTRISNFSQKKRFYLCRATAFETFVLS